MPEELFSNVYCPICGARLCRSSVGSQAYVDCKKCRAKIFYNMTSNGPETKVIQPSPSKGKKSAQSA